LSGEAPTLSWTINPAPKTIINVNTLTWDYTNPFTYDETEKKIQLTNVPEQVEVKYTDNAKTPAGTYTAKAEFTLKEAYANTHELSAASVTREWTINKATLTLDNLTWSQTEFEYDGTEKTVTITNVPPQVNVTYTDNAKTEVGTYTAVATFTLKAEHANNYVLQTTTLQQAWKIKAAPAKIQIDVSGVTWNQNEFEYDGTEKTVTLKNIPDHVKVEYSGEYQKTEIGKYTATATLSPASDEYELVGDTTLTWKWEIKAAAAPQKQNEFNYGGKVIVTTADGLTTDYELDVKELADFNRSIKSALDRYENGRTRVAYDIHFNKDGAKAQVNGEFTVKILLPEDLKGLNIKLVHFTDDVDDSSAKAVEYKIEGDYIVFTTDGFSDFAIAEVKTAPHVPLALWIILALIFVIIIILLIFLLKKEKQNPEPVAAPFEQTYFIQLVNADAETKARYEELKNHILEKKKDDESFKRVIDNIHEGFDDPEVITLIMVDGVLYAKVNDETFEISSDSNLKKCVAACDAALVAPKDETSKEENASNEASEEAPQDEENPSEEEAENEVEEQPTEEPAEEEAPAEEEQPTEEPAEEEAPAEEEQPAEEPAEEEAPAEEEQPAEDEAEEEDGQEVSAEDLAADGVTDDEPTEEGEESAEELAAEEAEEKEKKQKTVYHVSKRDNNGREWKVFKQGSKKVIKLFETQKEALDYAKQLAKNKNDGSYVLLHGLDGKLRKY
ncbi:MAG: DUF2188 domain-containing protein, partial [Bacilli bacterium]|nr:DUF2188 domain-containing protein [Bacilli bacterium]